MGGGIYTMKLSGNPFRTQDAKGDTLPKGVVLEKTWCLRYSGNDRYTGRYHVTLQVTDGEQRPVTNPVPCDGSCTPSEEIPDDVAAKIEAYFQKHPEDTSSEFG